MNTVSDRILLSPAMRSPRKVLIVGSGMMGLAHAWMARKAGYAVEVFERHGRPLGASVRNFGTIWPIGCVPGDEREQALFGAATWREVAAAAGIWHDPCGSLSLAYRDQAWAVIREFAAAENSAGFELLERDEVLARYPAVNPIGLRGALRSGDELLTVAAQIAVAQVVRHNPDQIRFVNRPRLTAGSAQNRDQQHA